MEMQIEATRRMSTTEARRLFLERIRRRLVDSGKPLTGFALEYWNALEPEDQQIVDQLWKDRKRRNDLDAIEKQFEAALYDSLQEDVTRDPATAQQYLRGLDGIKSVRGMQLQALVFAAAMRVKALQTPNRLHRDLAIVATLLVLLLGYWIGARLLK